MVYGMDAKTIGERIRNARLQKGMTQAQLSSALGCKYQTISNYENGKRSVDSATLKKICIVLGVKPIDLIVTPMWTDA
jgi:transcriptional regulator with XRE-family HTH domain